jgi:hypothetical protein
MKTKPSFVADCWSSVQYMFHREQRHICRRPAEISNPMKFLHSQTHYLYLHRKSRSLQTLIKSRLTLEQTCMRQIWSSGVPIPLAARSKLWVCGLSPVELAVFNPTGGMDICLLWVLCVVWQKSLRWANHSSRGVLPTVVRRCVWSRSLGNEETLAHWGLLRQKEKEKIRKYCYYFTV